MHIFCVKGRGWGFILFYRLINLFFSYFFDHCFLLCQQEKNKNKTKHKNLNEEERTSGIYFLSLRCFFCVLLV